MGGSPVWLTAARKNLRVLLDPGLHLRVHVRVFVQVRMSYAHSLTVRGAREDRAFLRIDYFVARRPPCAIADDAAGRLILLVERIQETRIRPHFDACGLSAEESSVRSVVRAAE